MGRRSVADASAALAAACGDFALPETVRLQDADMGLWLAVTRARAREEWSDVDLYHAANLVRCFADIERLSAELQSGGDLLTNDRGTVYVNPRHALLTQLSLRSIKLTRLLHLHAAVLTPDPRKVAPARRAEREAREAREAVEDLDDYVDDGSLLAKPPKLQ